MEPRVNTRKVMELEGREQGGDRVWKGCPSGEMEPAAR